MRQPTANLLGKRVLVLSEHKVLREAIKLGLKHRLRMDVVEKPSRPDGLDLVVVTALSFVDQESAPSFQASDHVPLLVISDQPLEPELEVKGVFYLGFPFSYEDLYAKAAEILCPAIPA